MVCKRSTKSSAFFKGEFTPIHTNLSYSRPQPCFTLPKKFRKRVSGNAIFGLLIVADEASLNDRREERLAGHFFSSDH
jgi:hypothetical protein